MHTEKRNFNELFKTPAPHYLSSTYGYASKQDEGSLYRGYKPFKPYLPLPVQTTDKGVYLSHDDDGNAVLVYDDGKVYAHPLALKEYSVAAFVSPMSGREYEESQKIRPETTYKISTRYFKGITPELRILYGTREFEIVPVLDLNERHEDCRLLRMERDAKTAAVL